MAHGVQDLSVLGRVFGLLKSDVTSRSHMRPAKPCMKPTVASCFCSYRLAENPDGLLDAAEDSALHR